VVGWAELAKPNKSDLLGFTFVQPNLRELRSRLPGYLTLVFSVLSVSSVANNRFSLFSLAS
jgi:hypothetical protein